MNEKQWAALSSLGVAIGLTIMKAIVGLLTNSLGILSEALHSGLDLMAAITTFYAVRVSLKPPDADHHFGHGKYESFSAFVEVVLLFATCAWISYEAIDRLLFTAPPTEVTVTSFLVMLVSIVLNFSRSRVLSRTAKKYNSQALEADALHFSTDIMSSGVVILGLIFVSLGYKVADPLAALGVVAVVLVLSLRLGRRTVTVLLDSAPEGLADQIRASVLSIAGVQSTSRIRARTSGAKVFVDLEVLVDRSMSFEAVNAIVLEVEREIRELAPESDIVVESKPTEGGHVELADQVRGIASQIVEVKGVHEVALHSAERGLHLELHVEVDPQSKLEEAHAAVSRLESTIKEKLPEITQVVTHIESASEKTRDYADRTVESERMVETIRKIATSLRSVRRCNEISVHTDTYGLHLTLTCVVAPNLSVTEAHDISTKVEEALRERIHGVSGVLVHMEPDSRKAES